MNEDRIKECSTDCSHYDLINQCCWIVSDRGLFTEIQEGDLCVHGLKEASQ